MYPIANRTRNASMCSPKSVALVSFGSQPFGAWMEDDVKRYGKVCPACGGGASCDADSAYCAVCDRSSLDSQFTASPDDLRASAEREEAEREQKRQEELKAKRDARYNSGPRALRRRLDERKARIEESMN